MLRNKKPLQIVSSNEQTQNQYEDSIRLGLPQWGLVLHSQECLGLRLAKFARSRSRVQDQKSKTKNPTPTLILK